MIDKVKMAIFRRMEERLRDSRNAARWAEERMREQDAEVQKLLPKLLEVSAGPVDHGAPGRNFRVCVDLNERMVHDIFVHGDSRQQLEYIGRMAGKMVERELATLNFSRYRDPEPPRYRFRPGDFDPNKAR